MIYKGIGVRISSDTIYTTIIVAFCCLLRLILFDVLSFVINISFIIIIACK